MNEQSTVDLLKNAAAKAAAYLNGLEDRPVQAPEAAVRRLAEALTQSPPERGMSADHILSFLDEFGSPATTASAGGRYFGFVTGGALPAAVAAQTLAVAWDQNGFSFTSSPAVALIEETALRWVIEALRLPDQSAAAIVTGATMANFTCLAAARNHVLASAGWNVDQDGLFGAPEPTIYLGAEAHASLFKVLSLLGLGRNRVVRLPVDRQGRIRAESLPAIKGPAIVCIQAGNVNSGAFDPAGAIIEWARTADAWVHVDGAFGLWALASPRLAHLADGFTAADSWATDAHKWLNVPYDSGVAIVRNKSALAAAMSISGAYLQPSERRDPIDYTPDSSRRARSVEILAALMTLGRAGLADLIERNCRQARRIAEALDRAGVEILNDVVLNQVVAAFGGAGRTERVIRYVQNDGTCWCGGTVWQGRTAMRISISSWATTDEDVERSIDAILRANRSCN